MSGVAKDETTPTATDGELPKAGGPENPDRIEAEAVAKTPDDSVLSDSETKAARRSAPHLRVVTEADAADYVAPVVSADSPYQRIGAVIRAARENQGLTLDQVSKETRVTVSHLRAIEDMTPNIIGEAVYVKGHIRTYARHLGLNADDILERYLKECAILKDPEKQEIAPPQVSGGLPVAVPVLGLVVVGLLGAAAYFVLSSGEQTKKPVAVKDAATTTAAVSTTAASAVDPGAPVKPALRIVALRRAQLEVRSSAGDKYVKRVFEPGESYPPRVGAGYTVSAPEDGSAFEWRLGDQSLGLLSNDPVPVYSQSVDLAAQRVPLNQPPAAIAATPAPGAPAAASATPVPGAAVPGAPAVPGAIPAPAKPKPTPAIAAAKPPAAAATEPKPAAPAAAPAPTPAIAPPTQSNDPSLQAYPG